MERRSEFRSRASQPLPRNYVLEREQEAAREKEREMRRDRDMRNGWVGEKGVAIRA